MGTGYTTIMYDAESLETGFSDVSSCRYDGVEVGLEKVRAAGPEIVADWLDTYDLDLYCVMSSWIESEAIAQRVADDAATVADLGAEFLGILPPQRHRNDDELVDAWLETISESAADAGLTPVLHHHGATHIERPDEIRRFLDVHDRLRLVFDTAHYYPYGDHYPEGNVTDGIERFADDIAYVHLKDVAPTSSFTRNRDALSAPRPHLDNVINYFRTFTDLGRGTLDFAAVREALDEIGYDGHCTIEIENRTEQPLVHAKRNADRWRELGKRD
ncbi:sugar phosphate isomerase/epimerase family protein [Natrinema salifodinae]|uniref:Inosose dehydratase n=1 Tax=Natrinema salifodinae TaxID=1202768 RepID=A0A1I0QTY3_9EURY|nr:sugar phosphate isomerase/epimerase [Natrinema salifodinae]SEW31045.1 inosose dehydratase [Natrinema salifodinae]